MKAGDSLGPYRIESVLGRGGMGNVYLATHERLRRRAALKVVSPRLAEDEDFRERFLRESRLAASLDHPHVIPIYDAGEADGVLYLAMRYVQGPSLDALIRARGALPLDETLRVAEQVGGALDAAHRAGLVHRDVKPANVLVAEPEGHAYLCDFGIARETDAGATLTGLFVGTVDYSAPEQLQGQRVDGRADVYSLACVVFHCLAGRPPFVADGEVGVAHAHLHDPPPRLSELSPGLPAALDGVLEQGLAKQPDERYATAGELAEALRQAAAGEGAPTRAVPAAVAAPAPRPRRYRWLLAGAAVVAAAGVAAGLLATRGSGPGSAGNAKLRTFVDRVENVLEQSSSGRREIGAALAAGLRCSVPARTAGQRIASVADNRQSVLEQLGTLPAPTQQADRAVTLLQRALQQSIEADRHYRDAFFTVRPGTACPLPPSADFRLARAADARATAAKRRFVAAFDPLASRVGRRTWTAADF